MALLNLYISINLGEPRSATQQIEILESATSHHLGYAHMPLTDIPFKAFLMDILHKFLRVSDLFVELLLDNLFQLDQMYTNVKYSPEKHKNIFILSRLLEKCKLAQIRQGFSSKEIRSHMKSLQGPNKNTFFNEINLQGMKNIFKKIDKKNEITRLWKQYWFIHNKLRCQYDYSSSFYENSCNHLLNLFMECYGKAKMTPYLHVTCIHLHEMHKLHGNLNYFCNEGLEKLNDLSTFTCFRNTNRRSTFIKQMLERDARLENDAYD